MIPRSQYSGSFVAPYYRGARPAKVWSRRIDSASNHAECQIRRDCGSSWELQTPLTERGGGHVPVPIMLSRFGLLPTVLMSAAKLRACRRGRAKQRG